MKLPFPFRQRLVSSAILASALGSPLAAQTSAAPVTRPTGRVEAIALTPQKTAAKRKSSGSYKLEVDPAAGWTDTGIVILPGDLLTLSSEGTLHTVDGRAITPAGVTRGWKDMLRSFPMDTANIGALIGRIGDNAASVPFAIGEHTEITARQPGNLFVRINLSDDLQPTGKLTLHAKFTVPHAAAGAPDTPEPAAPPATVLSILDTVPRRVTDEDGTPGDVVNFALLGTEQQVDDAFTRSGWIAVDANVDDALLHGVLSTLAHKPYVTMPMSKLFLFGRAQDRSYARAESLKVAAIRHHLRVWNTGQTVAGKPLWVGSATYDNGFDRDQRNGGVTHSIDPEIDTERRFLLDSFVNSGSVAAGAYVTPLAPVLAGHTATGGSFHSDGRILFLTLN